MSGSMERHQEQHHNDHLTCRDDDRVASPNLVADPVVASKLHGGSPSIDPCAQVAVVSVHSAAFLLRLRDEGTTYQGLRVQWSGSGDRGRCHHARRHPTDASPPTARTRQPGLQPPSGLPIARRPTTAASGCLGIPFDHLQHTSVDVTQRYKIKK